MFRLEETFYLTFLYNFVKDTEFFFYLLKKFVYLFSSLPVSKV